MFIPERVIILFRNVSVGSLRSWKRWRREPCICSHQNCTSYLHVGYCSTLSWNDLARSLHCADRNWSDTAAWRRWGIWHLFQRHRLQFCFHTSPGSFVCRLHPQSPRLHFLPAVIHLSGSNDESKIVFYMVVKCEWLWWVGKICGSAQTRGNSKCKACWQWMGHISGGEFESQTSKVKGKLTHK